MRLCVLLAVVSGLVGACTSRPFASREAVCRDYCERFTDLSCGYDGPGMFDHCVESCVTPPVSYPCNRTNYALRSCLSTVSCEDFKAARHDRRGPCGAEVRAQAECDREVAGPE